MVLITKIIIRTGPSYRKENLAVSTGFRDESHRVDFLGKEVCKVNWTHSPLCHIRNYSKFQELYMELANSLQDCEEARSSRKEPEPTRNWISKPLDKHISNFIQPRYAQFQARILSPGYLKDLSCCSCGKSGHRVLRCKQPLDETTISSRKAELLKYRNNKRNSAKRMLQEVTIGIHELMESEPKQCAIARAYFANAFCDK